MIAQENTSLTLGARLESRPDVTTRHGYCFY